MDGDMDAFCTQDYSKAEGVVYNDPQIYKRAMYDHFGFNPPT